MFKAITSWFHSTNPGSSKKSHTLTSTRDAFSLPTHSPTFHNPPHPSPYSARVQYTDSFDEPLAHTPSYTYPPPSSDDLQRYDTSQYDQSSTGLQKGHLLPLHRSSLTPPATYPSLSTTWSRIRAWLSEEYAELGDTLNWGCAPEILEQVEQEIGYTLPVSVRESFIVTDGQEPESLSGCPEGLFFGLTYLTLEKAFEEWKFWRTVDHDPSTGANQDLINVMQSIPSGHIRRVYSDPGWFPLVTDRVGNYLGIDMNPGDKGVPGQVIVFGRDFDVKIVLTQGDGEGSWGRWLAGFAEELEAGEGFEVGATSGNASEESDDGIGYESYFFDGSGRSKGQGGAPGGGGGLYLTGSYRGWPVLEAFADRAFHTWQRLGMISAPNSPVSNGLELKQPNRTPDIALVPVPDRDISEELPDLALTGLNLLDTSDPPEPPDGEPSTALPDISQIPIVTEGHSKLPISSSPPHPPAAELPVEVSIPHQSGSSEAPSSPSDQKPLVQEYTHSEKDINLAEQDVLDPPPMHSQPTNSISHIDDANFEETNISKSNPSQPGTDPTPPNVT